MKNLTLTCAMCLTLATPAVAESDALTAGRALSETIFGAMDPNDMDAVDMGDFVSFGRDAFFSMDYNRDGLIEFDEFTSWDFGYSFISEDAGETTTYQTAQRILFAYWDRDRDGVVSENEFHRSLIADYRRADLDNDAFLTRQEFLDGYVVIDIYRAAVVGN